MDSTPSGGPASQPARRSATGTPLLQRATSAEPPSTTHRPLRTPGSHGRNLGASSARKMMHASTPHGRQALATRETRRAIFNTPGRLGRRRSIRDQRETPRDILRALSSRLAPVSKPITSSSSSPPASGGGRRRRGSSMPAILEDGDLDDDDDIPIDRPRLSLPLDEEEDEDESDLQPPRSSGLEDLDNFTVQSVELPRRAISEQPLRDRYSIRMSDFMAPQDIFSDDVGIDSGFFPPAQFDDDDDDERGDVVGDDTYERLESEAGRRDTLAAGRPSDFGLADVQIEGNESTFVLAPQLGESPSRPDEGIDDVEVEQPAPADNEDEDEDEDVAEADEFGLDEVEVEAATSKAAAGGRSKRKKIGKKQSRHGIEYRQLPVGVVKRLAQTLAQSSGVKKAKISPDTVDAIMQASDWFFEQLGDDLQAYAKHAGRKTIDESDMTTLMRRQRQTSSTATPFALAQRHLPRELLQELRMPAPVLSKSRRRPKVRGGEDADEDDGT